MPAARALLAWVDEHTVPRAEVAHLRAQVEDMRRYERDNHHNARLCPYCEPDEAARDRYREENADVYVRLLGDPRG